MFGQNPLRKQELDPDGILAVQSIFPTIQGEGPNAGMPAIFIRVAGCTLRCHFCDTDFESNINNRLTVEQVLEQSIGTAWLLHKHNASFLPEPLKESNAHDQRWYALKNPPKLIILTGGEPFRQNILPLIAALTENDCTVQVETAGTHWFDPIYNEDVRELFLRRGSQFEIVCSPKTGKVHPKIAEYCSDWKYIIRVEDPSIEATGLPLAVTQRAAEDRNKPAPALYYANPEEGNRIWVQPCDEQDPIKNKANRDRCIYLSMRYGYRVSLQQHKILNIE